MIVPLFQTGWRGQEKAIRITRVFELPKHSDQSIPQFSIASPTGCSRRSGKPVRALQSRPSSRACLTAIEAVTVEFFAIRRQSARTIEGHQDIFEWDLLDLFCVEIVSSP